QGGAFIHVAPSHKQPLRKMRLSLQRLRGGDACSVAASTLDAPSPVAPPNQHLKKKKMSPVSPLRQNEGSFVNSFKTRVFS
ncbi:hypothetical protein PIB30_031319, partial [Stylosanthes scabra]|nr:hypothetical protein [Stylosanthes scabra]